jgi:uncharacterized protein
MYPRAICAITFLLLAATSFGARGQSFNCVTADRPDEVLICQNDRLSRRDERMSSLYFTLRNQLWGAERQALKASQRSWLQSRMDCERDYQCIEGLYEQRIVFLSNY